MVNDNRCYMYSRSYGQISSYRLQRLVEGTGFRSLKRVLGPCQLLSLIDAVEEG